MASPPISEFQVVPLDSVQDSFLAIGPSLRRKAGFTMAKTGSVLSFWQFLKSELKRRSEQGHEAYLSCNKIPVVDKGSTWLIKRSCLALVSCNKAQCEELFASNLAILLFPQSGVL